MRPIDADAIEYHMMAKEDWLGCTVEDSEMAWKVDIDAMPTVEAVPVSFIESEIKRMELELYIAMSEDDDETAERWIIRKTTLELTLAKWMAERKEE